MRKGNGGLFLTIMMTLKLLRSLITSAGKFDLIFLTGLLGLVKKVAIYIYLLMGLDFSPSVIHRDNIIYDSSVPENSHSCINPYFISWPAAPILSITSWTS